MAWVCDERWHAIGSWSIDRLVEWGYQFVDGDRDQYVWIQKGIQTVKGHLQHYTQTATHRRRRVWATTTTSSVLMVTQAKTRSMVMTHSSKFGDGLTFCVSISLANMFYKIYLKLPSSNSVRSIRIVTFYF